jgi:hypothetical protein
MESTIFIGHTAKKEDDDFVDRKVTPYLIRGLVLTGFVVAPVAAGAAGAFPDRYC